MVEGLTVSPRVFSASHPSFNPHYAQTGLWLKKIYFLIICVLIDKKIKHWPSDKNNLTQIYLATHKSEEKKSRSLVIFFNSTTDLCSWQRLKIVLFYFQSCAHYNASPSQIHSENIWPKYKAQVLPALCSHWEQLVAAGPGQPGPTEARTQVQLILSLDNEVMKF